jgi:thymidylate synthase
LDYDCHIWDGDAYKNYLEETQHEASYTKEQFINLIKTDNAWANVWGELGPIYGKQWRSWKTEDEHLDGVSYFKYPEIDQIQNLINELKTNPDSRRLMVSAWNVGELDKMVLPPCHYGFQLYTRKTTRDEKIVHPGKYRAISLMWNQRSVDTFLGLPFNIASYGLLLEIIAKEVNMIPDELIGNLGDVHLYKNHIEQAKEQISRTSFDLPTIQITERNWYQHELVKEKLGEKTLDEKLKSYRPDCFELIGYESHPKIKAPLSN